VCVVVIVIVISELLERHSKAKRTTAPVYSRALRPTLLTIPSIRRSSRDMLMPCTRLLSCDLLDMSNRLIPRLHVESFGLFGRWRTGRWLWLWETANKK